MSVPVEWQIDGEEFLLNPIAIDENKVEFAESIAPTTEVVPPVVPDSVPPSPERIIEAMLFVGDAPVTIDHIRQTIRGLDDDEVRELIQRIGKRYFRQRRPYGIVSRSDGYVLAMKSTFVGLREKLVGGPREARLSQPSLDLLSLIAYRQPISRDDLETIRGHDCGSAIRSLLRTGFIAKTRSINLDDREHVYKTTGRFLDHFQLNSLDDLPRLGESQLVT